MEVGHTSDFKRIAALPIREWDHRTTEAAIEYWTRRFAINPDAPTAVLRANQARSLTEIYQNRGGVLQVPVGGGKTLTSVLAPAVVGSRKPLLIADKEAGHKTLEEIKAYREHWHIPPNITLKTPAFLSSRTRDSYLEDEAFDFIAFDEAHAYLKFDPRGTSASARIKRLFRYWQNNPQLVITMFTGTLAKDGSLLVPWVLSLLALRDGSPYPLSSDEALTWCDALDPRLPIMATRVAPGALMTLSGTGARPIDRARNGVFRRAFYTPGYLVEPAVPLDKHLHIVERPLSLPPDVKEAIDVLMHNQLTPNNELVEDPLARGRHGRQLSTGHYQRWDPPAPQPWLDAAAAWRRWVNKHRDTVVERDGRRVFLDSPSQVAAAYPDAPALRRWRQVKPSFTPNPKMFIISHFMLDDIANWLAESAAPGLVWTEHAQWGPYVAEQLGIPYFGQGDGAALFHHRGSAVLSLQCYHKAFNLQWSHRALFTTNPPSPDVWQQAIGRQYRPGQTQDVTASVYLHSDPAIDGMETALDKSVGSAANSVETPFLFSADWHCESLNLGRWRLVNG